MLVLASQSPRRSEILRQAGIPFTVRVAAVDETSHDVIFGLLAFEWRN